MLSDQKNALQFSYYKIFSRKKAWNAKDLKIITNIYLPPSKIPKWSCVFTEKWDKTYFFFHIRL